MNPQIQGCMEKIREMDVPEKKKIQLCNVLAGIENSNNEEAKLESWYEFLDLFFNDDSILEEIYKKMKTNGLCFLHLVNIHFYKGKVKPDVANAFLNSIRKHKEKKNLKLKLFNILDDDNEDPELKQIQDEINKLLTQDNLGKGLNKTRKMKKKQQGKNKKRSTKPKTKNNYKRDI